MRVNRFVALLLCAALLTLTSAAFAQKQKPQKGGKRQAAGAVLATLSVPALDAALKLTDDQKTKLTAIHAKYTEDTKPLRPAAGAPADPMNAVKLREISAKTDAEILSLLTEEQKGKIATAVPMVRHIHDAGLPYEVFESLKLTDDQKTKLAALGKEINDQSKTAPAADRRTKSAALRKEAQPKLDAILTAEQKTVLTEYTAAHRGGKGKKKKLAA